MAKADKRRELHEKERRINNCIESGHYDAIIIGRQDNFAWLTSGGRNFILSASDVGAAMVVFTKSNKYVVANTMDGKRIIDEELADSDYELINLKWHEKTIEETICDLVKGCNAVSDVYIAGIQYDPSAVYRLHFPLMKEEVERYRTHAAMAESILRKVADELKPGMSEKDAEALLNIEYAKHGFVNSVILVGADARIEKYRHPVPTDSKIQRMLLLAPAPRKDGLYMPISRMICFDDHLPSELREKYDTLLRFEANVFSRCVAGTRFVDIMEFEKKLYQASSYPDEWQGHFMGGITGYYPNDPVQYRNPEAKVKTMQTFNWYLTVTGAKVEEILLTNESGNELLSVKGAWPLRKMEACGEEYMLPDILMK